MTFSSDITIVDLLRQREAEFVVVWQCEQKIRHLLGDADYPFQIPDDLPSWRSSKPSTRKAAVSKQPLARPTTPFLPAGDLASQPVRECRKLDPTRENAYRLVFLRNGVKDSSFQTDSELNNILSGLNCPDFKLLSLETVFFTDLDDWQVVDTLWADLPDGL